MTADVPTLCGIVGLPAPEPEFRFDPGRRWRLDWAWPEYLVAVEIDGGNWIRGRHARPKGIEADHEKRNAAQLLGWRVFTATTDMAADGRLMALLEQIKEMVDE